MKITQICSCSILTIIGILLIILDAIGGIAYFKYSPDVLIYFGVLFLSISTISWGISLAKPIDSDQ
ncbi:hypothetical protein DFR86_03895 [Acidianus sulfidivorans JP7]|nr:hypothetical protein [Acidianus sulfidivorans]AWR96782.2 hypothetical protein DFR86_03895 [Acidianus sulfidivorans JP7]